MLGGFRTFRPSCPSRTFLESRVTEGELLAYVRCYRGWDRRDVGGVSERFGNDVPLKLPVSPAGWSPGPGPFSSVLSQGLADSRLGQ